MAVYPNAALRGGETTKTQGRSWVMNEIRKNTEEEHDIVKATFKMPLLFKVFYFVMIGMCAILTIVSLVGLIDTFDEFTNAWDFPFACGLVLLIVAVVLFALHFRAIKHSSCTVSNKRIYGKTSVLIGYKQFSYRLDTIDHIEMNSALGLQTLAINFSAGNGAVQPVRYGVGSRRMQGANIFRVNYIVNGEEVHGALSELLMSVKNDKDVAADIEMRKADAQSKQAAAFEKMADKLGADTQNAGGGYIAELKALKELYDEGVITEEEFGKKKAELLGK